MLRMAVDLGIIYLLLSLVAAEVQSFITDVLQWRAEHLWRSIATLLQGDASRSSDHRVLQRLYEHPLIQSLNLAQGYVSTVPRLWGEGIRSLGAALTRTPKRFGDRTTAPIQIPPHHFAIALMETLQIPALSHKYCELILRHDLEGKLKRVQDHLAALRNSLGDDFFLESEFVQLRQSLNEITTGLIYQRADLSQSVDQAIAQLAGFIDNTETHLHDDHHCQSIFRQRLPYLKQALQIRLPEPTILEVVSLLTEGDRSDTLHSELWELVQEAMGTVPYVGSGAESPVLVDALDSGSALESIPMAGGQERTVAMAGEIDCPESRLLPGDMLLALPHPLRQSLKTLATIAQSRATTLAEGIQQLERELAHWFAQSMTHSASLYSRNSKGVSLVLGFIFAIGMALHPGGWMGWRMTQRLMPPTERTPVAMAVLTRPDERTSAPAIAPLPHYPRFLPFDRPMPRSYNQGLSPWHNSWGYRLGIWLISGVLISAGISFWQAIMRWVTPLRHLPPPHLRTYPKRNF